MHAQKKRLFSRMHLGMSQSLMMERGNVVDYTSRVCSLDQLCAQATGLDPILRAKVQEWALRARGHFRRAGGEGTEAFVLWEDVCDSPERRKVVQWGKLKGVGRAVEKLIRSYGEDVSRLLDVCRQSIIFDSVGDVADCLQLILSDPDVSVVRLRNRLDPGYDSAQSAGYRDVSLNLRLSTPDSAGLGLDTHVCEVLLLVRGFAEIKNAAGHKRYIDFRNRRGE